MFLSPRFAQGAVVAPSLIGAFIGREYYFSQTEEVLNAFVFPDAEQDSRIFLVPVPASHVGKSFGQLLHDWSATCVPLGLYRPFLHGDTKATSGYSRRYVCTAPDSNSILSEVDLVYVVAPRAWARVQLDLPETPSWRKDLLEYFENDKATMVPERPTMEYFENDFESECADV